MRGEKQSVARKRDPKGKKDARVHSKISRKEY